MSFLRSHDPHYALDSREPTRLKANSICPRVTPHYKKMTATEPQLLSLLDRPRSGMRRWRNRSAGPWPGALVKTSIE